jgi:hypothetical protein
MRHRYLIPHGVLEIEPKSIPHNNITQQQKWRAAVSGLPAGKIAILQKKVNAFSRNKFIQKTLGTPGGQTLKAGANQIQAAATEASARGNIDAETQVRERAG